MRAHSYETSQKNMKKKVYIFIDELNRDAVVAAALETYFKAFEMDVYFGNRFTLSFFHRFESPFDFHIFPNVVFFSNFAHRLKDRSVGILPTESICSTPDTESRLAFHLFQHKAGTTRNDENLIQRKIAFYFVWGSAHYEIAKKFIPESIKKIKIIGHPRYDRLCQKELGQNRSTVLGVLGVVTRYDFINPFDMRPQLPFLVSVRRGYRGVASYYHSDGYDVEDIWHNQVCDFNNTLNVITEAERLGLKVSIRVHPRENLSQWRDVLLNSPTSTFLADSEVPFSHWLTQVDAVIAPPSTSFYDCALLNKCCINISNLNPRRKIHVAPNSDDSDRILDYYPRPSTIEDVLAHVQKLTKPDLTPQFLSLLEDEVGYSHRQESLKSASTIIAHHLNQGIETQQSASDVTFEAFRRLKSLNFKWKKVPLSSAVWPLDDDNVKKIRATVRHSIV